VDLGDLFGAAPYLGPTPSARRSPAEQAASFLALFLLPVIDFCVVLFADVEEHPRLAMAAMPLGFALLSYLAARRLGANVAYAVLLTLGCGLLCLCASVIAAMVNAFFGFL